MRLVVCLALLACGGGTPVADLEISECLNPDGDAEFTEELLLLTAEQRIDVAHRAHELNCGHELDVRMDVDEDTRRIAVTYEDNSKEPANCTCVYNIAYTIDEIADGAWTVIVPGGLQAEGIVD